MPPDTLIGRYPGNWLRDQAYAKCSKWINDMNQGLLKSQKVKLWAFTMKAYFILVSKRLEHRIKYDES